MNLTTEQGELGLNLAASPRTTSEPRVTLMTLAALLVLGSLLYLVLGSGNFTGDDMIEVQAIRDGGSALLPPNHLLSRPLARLVYDVMTALGYSGNTLLPARIVVGGSAVLGLGLFYLWMTRLVQSRAVALIAALGFGMSWAYWVFAIGMVYIMPAVPCVLGAVIALWSLFSRPDTEIPRRPLVALSLLTALAILFWQANVFLVPGALLGLWAQYRNRKANFVRAVAAYLVISGTVTLAVYLLASAAHFGPDWSVGNFVSWVSGRGGGLSLASWGVLDVSRVAALGPTLIAVFAPVWEGLGLRQLLSGEFDPAKLLPLLSILALALLALIPVGLLIKRRSLAAGKRNTALGLLFAAACYMPFIIWWDPTSPADLIIPSIAFWGVIAILWSEIVSNRMVAGTLAVLAAALAVANFTSAIWPRHANPNPDLQQADCIAGRLDGNDLYVSNWEGYARYLNYFHHIPIFLMMDASLDLGGPERALDDLANRFETVRGRGGQVYIADLAVYTPETLGWLSAETGIEPSHLERIYGTPAFTCGDITHFVLNDPPASAGGSG